MLWMALTLGVLGISLGILLAIFLYAVLIKDHVGLHKSDYLKKALCLLMVLKMTIF